MNLIPCNTCESESFQFLFHKESSLKEIFSIAKCKSCGLVQVNPQPEDVMKYYADEYFTQRTDRGYDNYYSTKIKNEISRVFKLNLQDLDFYEWSAGLTTIKDHNHQMSSLDIGCAAGYFVDFMNASGWDSMGIEIAKDPAEFGKKKLGLNIIQKNFLDWDKGILKNFSLITLWATIEHLHQPKETLLKAYDHLLPGGMLIVSTCRYGFLAKLRGKKWRYMNVPEHLYYYSLSGLIDLASSLGFREYKHITYGSGMTSRKESGFLFKILKIILDWLVKTTNQGDMMAVAFVKD